jgi:predicted KAP-like P-loop ATPase
LDDVDRLSTEEIRLLFQLIKANADFPNLVYLLLFQRDIVEKSLEAIAPSIVSISGREFLEKIVQVGFDIPLIEHRRLERVLFDGLNNLLADESVARHFDEQRWGNIFIPGLRPYFETLRDVRRLLATLAFQVSLFRGSGSFEVNPIDLVALGGASGLRA